MSLKPHQTNGMAPMSHDLVLVAIEGGVVTKPTLTHTAKGTVMCKFGVVCMPKWMARQKNVKDKMYFTVTAIGKIGETIYPMLRPGVPIRVEGELNDGIYRDHLTDEPKIGRVIYATRVRTFVYWKRRSISDKTKELQDNVDKMTVPDIDLDDLPF
jgi:single-stranded DNA-binding protein